MCTILTRHASINQIKSHWKTSEGEKQAYICCMFVEGKSKTVFFPSDTLIYGICRDGTKNNNIRACEHLILGQFRMGARSAIYAPLQWCKCNSIYLWQVKKHKWETTKYFRPRVRKNRYLRQRREKTNCLWYGISLICKHEHAVRIFGAAELYSAQCTPGGFRLD